MDKFLRYFFISSIAPISYALAAMWDAGRLHELWHYYFG